MPTVAIVGGGVSGLSVAYYLSRLGIRSTLIEKEGRLGGLIKTDVIDGCQLEAGPDSFLAAKPAVSELAAELTSLGDPLESQIMGSNDARRRVLIARNGSLVPMPRGMVMMAPAEWKGALGSPLFSTATKLGFVGETFFRPRERQADISVGQLVVDHFGHEVLERVAAPLLSGVYGGDAAQLSAQSVLPRFLEYERTYGSIVRGVRKERRRNERRREKNGGSMFLTFRDGMQSLTDALSGAIQGSTEFHCAGAERIGRIGTRWRISAGDLSVDADHVVVATAAYTVARMLEEVAPQLASELDAIRYSSAILVTLVFEKETLGHALDAFGFLVPGAERQTLAAATWVSTKFPSRIPDKLAALRGFIVDPEAGELLGSGDEQLVRLVRADFERLMGITAEPRLSTIYRWPKSMPQYVVGHGERQERTGKLLTAHPGLHLISNYRRGVGIPDCISLAKETANIIGGEVKEFSRARQRV